MAKHLGEYLAMKAFLDGDIAIERGDTIPADVAHKWPNLLLMKKQGWVRPVDDGRCGYVVCKRLEGDNGMMEVGTLVSREAAMAWPNFSFLESRGYVEPCKVNRTKRSQGRQRKAVS